MCCRDLWRLAGTNWRVAQTGGMCGTGLTRLLVGVRVQPFDSTDQNSPVARFWKTPANQSEITLLGQSRQALQLGIHLVTSPKRWRRMEAKDGAPCVT